MDTVVLALAMGPFSMEWFAPLVSTALHDLFSAGWMSILVSITHGWKQVKKALQCQGGRRVMMAALLGGPAGMSGYVFAVRFLGPSLTAAISSFYPALAALISVVVFRQRLKVRQVMGLLVSLSCIALMGAASSDSPSFGLGLFWVIVCLFGWALEGVIIEHSITESLDNGIALFLRQTTSAWVFIAALLPLTGCLDLVPQVMDNAWLWLAAASLCGTASYLSYYKAIGLIGVVKAMPLNSTYCAWTVLFSFLFEGIVPTMTQIILCAGIIGGAGLCAKE